MVDNNEDPASATLPADELDLVEKVKEWYRDADRTFSKWRTAAREDYAFVAGDQWDSKTRSKLMEQDRPAIVYNRTQTTIDTVSGMEVGNRQEVRYIPRQDGAAGVNQVLTGAAKWMRDQCDAEDEESDAFTDMVICGEGDTETRLDYETDPEGAIQINRVDPMEMWWDPTAKKKNRADARYVIRIREIPLSEAIAMFPEADEDDLDAAWARQGQEGTDPHDATDAKFYREDQGDKINRFRPKKVTIAECQWWEREKYFRVADQYGETNLSEEDHRTLKKRTKELGDQAPPFQSITQWRRVFKRAFIGARLLAEVDTPCDIAFTYKCMTGKRDRNDNSWYGLVRNMKDPQRWANVFFSSILHHIQTSGKGIMAEETAFAKPRQAEEDWANSEAIIWLRQGGADKIQPKPSSNLPPQLSDMLSFSINSIRDVTGVNLELMGMTNRDQAGVVEQARQKAGFTILAGMFNSLRRYRKEQGRVLLWYITNFLSDGRLVRIVGDEGAKYVPLIHQADTVTYDVIVDDSPSSPNQKDATWATLQSLMPTLLTGKIPVPVEGWVEIIKQSPLPATFAEKMSDILMTEQQKQQQAGPPPDPEVMKAQAQINAKQQEMQMKAQADQQAMSTRNDQHAQEMALHRDRASVELQTMAARANTERQIATAKAATEITIAQQKHENDMELARQKAAVANAATASKSAA